MTVVMKFNGESLAVISPTDIIYTAVIVQAPIHIQQIIMKIRGTKSIIGVLYMNYPVTFIIATANLILLQQQSTISKNSPSMPHKA